MGKFYFYYGTMGAGKTAMAIAKAYEFLNKSHCIGGSLTSPTTSRPSDSLRGSSEPRQSPDGEGSRVYVYLPNKVWKSKLESRNGSSINVDKSLLGDDHLSLIEKNSIVIVDEAQFLNDCAVDSLKRLSSYDNCLVFCFGLLTDFRKKLFEGTKHIIEVADSIREIPCMCDNCTKKAQYNFRITEEDEIVVLEKNKYRSLCSKCFDQYSELVEAEKC